MKSTEFMSSVSDITYSEDRKELRITIGGVVLIHRDVPSGIHAQLAVADNKAQFYMVHIRDIFPRV